MTNSDPGEKIIRITLGKVSQTSRFFTHFQKADHSDFINYTEIGVIDKTDPCDPTRRVDFWIDAFKTCYPLGFNNIDPYP